MALQRRALQRQAATTSSSCLFSFAPHIAASVPRQLVAYFANGGPLPSVSAPIVTTHVSAGALVLADISHYSQLVASLADDGDVGMQTLCRVMETCFTKMIDTIDMHGGDCIKFAGDALLVSFPTIEASAACALALLAATSASCGVEIHIAIAFGDLLGLHLGGVHHAFEYVVGGAPFQQLQDIVDCSGPNSITLSQVAWDALGPSAIGHALVDGRAYALTGLASSSSSSSSSACESHGRMTPPELCPSTLDAIRKYAPAPLMATIDVQQFDLVAEYRQCSILFVTLQDLSLASPDIDVHRLQTVFVRLQHILHCHGGFCRQFLADDKGTVLIAAFGVHGFSHFDNALRALKTALEMADALADLAVAATLGVATGKVYAGLLGCARRHEYAVVGSAVVTAARLAGLPTTGEANATCRVLCDAPTRDIVQHERDVALTRYGDVYLKGQRGPAVIYSVAPASAHRASGRSPMLGREALVASVLRHLVHHDRALVVLEGSIGSGRSCFLNHIESLVLKTTSVLRYRASWHDAPLALWRRVAQSLLTPLEDLDELRRVLHRNRPVLIIDDFEAIDEASLERLGELLADAPLRVLVSVPTTTTCQTLRFRLRHHFKRVYQWSFVRKVTVRLPPLAPEHIAALSCQLLHASSLAPDVHKFISATSLGSPLWVQQIVHCLHTKGFVTLSKNHRRVTFTPAFVSAKRSQLSSIHDIVLAQVEELSETQRWLLKLGAIIGSSFQINELLWLCHGFSHLQAWVDGDTLQWQLGLLCKAGYLEVVDGGSAAMVETRRRSHSETQHPKLQRVRRGHSHHDLASALKRARLRVRYRFCHANVRDALLDVFLPAQRRMAHSLMIDLLDDLSVLHEPSHLVRLAHHCVEAGMRTKALTYLGRASLLAAATDVALFDRLVEMRFAPPASRVSWLLASVRARRLARPSDNDGIMALLAEAVALVHVSSPEKERSVPIPVIGACLAMATCISLEYQLASSSWESQRVEGTTWVQQLAQLPDHESSRHLLDVDVLAGYCIAQHMAKRPLFRRAIASAPPVLYALAARRIGSLCTEAVPVVSATATDARCVMDAVHTHLAFGASDDAHSLELMNVLMASEDPRLAQCLRLVRGDTRQLATCIALSDDDILLLGGLPARLVSKTALAKYYDRYANSTSLALHHMRGAIEALRGIATRATTLMWAPQAHLLVYAQWLALLAYDMTRHVGETRRLSDHVTALARVCDELFPPTTHGLGSLASAFFRSLTSLVLQKLEPTRASSDSLEALSSVASRACKVGWLSLRRHAMYVVAMEDDADSKVSWVLDVEVPDMAPSSFKNQQASATNYNNNNNYSDASADCILGATATLSLVL
ncbi:hypothetical protein SPRG_22079 [Saprolegnia parasitica CBS 223.65]|uniref:Guanylate cyclase domain-containing protein n=1 Tax=Saprolegnia parasitica (strain CBS 223.65) TaxID=695850 RepID=A0A067CUW6_SAPPC|nr:hypothetical protein SPRG_22079 [Saprolegnia parasitica CBS 223.65]KDO34288.1 hypothetical protein SPRG_22079 [Saprolegnia parasitica CBS 223.65]|eukprot:XP_012195343.1 hypothetical protein SPRG_22079 [Saprolegnia parasitica CBS 223.65]